MTYVNGKPRWDGRVYDGPLEGEYRAHHSPYFEFNFNPSSFARPYFDLTADLYVYRMAYRWSNPLRAWVLDWRTAPKPPKSKRTGKV